MGKASTVNGWDIFHFFIEEPPSTPWVTSGILPISPGPLQCPYLVFICKTFIQYNVQNGLARSILVGTECTCTQRAGQVAVEWFGGMPVLAGDIFLRHGTIDTQRKEEQLLPRVEAFINRKNAHVNRQQCDLCLKSIKTFLRKPGEFR